LMHRLSGKSDGSALSMNLNYVFINQRFRRGGFFKRLTIDLPEIARRLLAITNPGDISWPPAESPEMLMFIEQNDPYGMSPEEYALDTEFTGLDQLARIGIWARLGAKVVDFPYVQPPLTAQQKADHNLVYGVLGANTDSLDSCLLLGHLRSFFGISVLKGADPMSEPNAAQQLRSLAGMCEARETVRLLDAAALQHAPSPLSDTQAARPTSLRKFLRG
jgi:hypothetical protein